MNISHHYRTFTAHQLKNKVEKFVFLKTLQTQAELFRFCFFLLRKIELELLSRGKIKISSMINNINHPRGLYIRDIC